MQQFFEEMIQNPWPNIFAGLMVWAFTQCLTVLWNRRTDWRNWSVERKQAKLRTLYEEAKYISEFSGHQIIWAASAVLVAVWNATMMLAGLAAISAVVGMSPAAPGFEISIQSIGVYLAMFSSLVLVISGFVGLINIYWKFHRQAKAVQTLADLKVEADSS